MPMLSLFEHRHFGFRHTFLRLKKFVILIAIPVKGVNYLLSLSKNSCYNTDNEYCCEDEQTERKEIKGCSRVGQDACK